MAKLIIKNRFGQVPTELLNNPDISLKAKGIFAYLQSKPEDWDFSVERMATQLKEGREALSAALKELEQTGHLRRTAAKNSNGQWDGYYYELLVIPSAGKPLPGKPLPGNPSTDKPSTEKPYTLSKKDSSKIDISKIEYIPPEFFKRFQELCGSKQIAIDLKPSKYQKLQEEYSAKDVMWWREVTRCINWLSDNDRRKVSATRLRNWMENTIKFNKEAQIKSAQRYQDKQNLLAPKSKPKLEPLWKEPV